MMPAPATGARPEETLKTARSSIEAMRRLMLTPPVVQAKLSRGVHSASALVEYFEHDNSTNADGQLRLQQYLALLQGVLERYHEGARIAAGAGRQSVESISQLLEDLAIRFDALHEKLIHQQDAEISNEIKALNQALTEIDPLTARLRGNSS